MRRNRTVAITKSSMIATVIVLVIVVVVLALLYESFLPGPATSTTDNQISIQDATIYYGSASKQSFTSSCSGDAVLSLELYNPMSATIRITNVTFYGSSLNGNATALVSLSNSCLTIAQSVPTLNATSSNTFVGYANVALLFGQPYKYEVQFDNGQRINQTLLAEA